jgi:release factor glutamine methyltransferase
VKGMKQKMKQIELIKFGEKCLRQKNIQDANIKARLLLQHVLNQNKQQIIINSENMVDKIKTDEYEECIKKLINGTPLQYITHVQQFMGLDFYVDENVLIPQPDTEILVEESIKLINKKQTVEVLDLCTGSGAIAVSIGHYCRQAKVIATDISKSAINVARKNASTNNVNINFIESDLFNQISDCKFDFIISNPPYIETDVINTLSEDVKNEPYIALNGGKDGLDFYKKILNEAHNYLKQNGYLLLEIGYNQARAIRNLQHNNLKLVTQQPIKDLAGNDRVMIFIKEN